MARIEQRVVLAAGGVGELIGQLPHRLAGAGDRDTLPSPPGACGSVILLTGNRPLLLSQTESRARGSRDATEGNWRWR